MSSLLHELIVQSAEKTPDAEAIRYQKQKFSYAWLAHQVERAARGLIALGLGRRERVAVYLDKRPETVIGMFAAAAAGAVFVPVNPLLKSEQVAYILRDCNVRILITSRDRLHRLKDVLPGCHDLRQVVIIGDGALQDSDIVPPVAAWDNVLSQGGTGALHRSIDSDMVAILYTSGSTGKPKGVVLSHRNMVTGAVSVASYLGNSPNDCILSVLPFSFDYGFSQLSTMFYVGARVVLMNYLLPRDVIVMIESERISGLAAVPPLWIQLAQLEWPPNIQDHLGYITNSGGTMPRAVVETLRAKLPKTNIFLMYGLTEAFRSTFLPPNELARRPDSIGKAIPNAEILVARPDGELCAPGEPGELVHRGALVALGYWNDPAKTAERFRPAPGQEPGLTLPEIAVWSGDTVRTDEEGFLYFIGRKDDMIKTSGYRVSPTEIEEVIYSTGLVGEAVALGVPHPILGQAIVVVATPLDGSTLDVEALMAECKRRLPTFMVPGTISIRPALPRNPNGKIDRTEIANAFVNHFGGATG